MNNDMINTVILKAVKDVEFSLEIQESLIKSKRKISELQYEAYKEIKSLLLLRRLLIKGAC